MQNEYQAELAAELSAENEEAAKEPLKFPQSDNVAGNIIDAVLYPAFKGWRPRVKGILW